jgi:hypothetical protein
MSSSPDFLQARYANVFRVGFNEYEMILDFGQVDPDGTAEAVHTRIILAVPNGRLLLVLLSEAVANHDQSFERVGAPADMAK